MLVQEITPAMADALVNLATPCAPFFDPFCGQPNN
jgi:hypothetical protein